MQRQKGHVENNAYFPHSHPAAADLQGFLTLPYLIKHLIFGLQPDEKRERKKESVIVKQMRR